MSEHILIIEDDLDIANIERDYLMVAGYDVTIMTNGTDGIEAALNTPVDLIILDVMLPEMDGFEVCRQIRDKVRVPIVMVTARLDDIDKIRGLGVGADDYIEKPFSLPVLKARIDALLQKQDIFEYKNVCVNFKSYTAKIDGKTIDINAKELEILKYLLDHAGIALSRAQILDHVWKESEDVPYDRVIDVYIKELRKKLGLDCITTIRNVGYKLEKS